METWRFWKALKQIQTDLKEVLRRMMDETTALNDLKAAVDRLAKTEGETLKRVSDELIGLKSQTTPVTPEQLEALAGQVNAVSDSLAKFEAPVVAP